MTVRELITVLGFDADTQEAKDYGKAFDGIVKVTAAATAATAAAGAAFLKMAGDMEQTEIAMTTMLGSAEEANTLIKDITDFASKTPFQLTGLIESSKQLLAFGFESEEVLGTMESLGNIAAGVGKDKLPTMVRSLGKIRTKGKATMEELNMMLEAGVPILDELSASMGVTTQELFKMITAGKVSFNDVNNALTSLGGEGGQFAGLMEKQSKSFLGIWSNIIDLVEITAIKIGQDLLPVAKEIAAAVRDWLDANQEMVISRVVAWFRSLAFAITWVALFIKTMIDRMGGFQEVMSWVLPLLKVMVPTLIALAAAAKLYAVAQWIVNAAMAANPITLFIAGLLALIAGWVLLYNKHEGIRKSINRIFEAFKPLIPVVMFIAKLIGKVLLGAVVLYGKAMIWWIDKVLFLWSKLFQGIAWIIGKIPAILGKAVDLFFWLAEKGKDAFSFIWNLLDNKALQMLVLAFAPLLGIVIIIAKNFDKIWETVQNIIDGLKKIKGGATEAATGTQEENINRARDTSEPLWKRMISSFSAGVSGGGATTPGMGPSIRNTSAKNTTVQNEVNVNLPAGASPDNAEAVGRAVREELDRTLRGAQADGGAVR